MIGLRDVYEVNVNSFGGFHSIVVTMVMLFVFIAMMIFFHRSRMVFYAIILELVVGFYLALFLMIVNSEDPEQIFWLSRWMYTVFIGHTVLAVFAISYINQQKQNFLKIISIAVFLLVLGLIFSNDRWMLTRKIMVTTYSMAVKGPLIGIVFFYMFVIAVVFIVQCIKLYRLDRPRYVATWPIYFGMIFIALNSTIVGALTLLAPNRKPTIYLNVLGFSIFLIIYLFKEVKNTRLAREKMLQTYVYDDLTKVYSRSYVLEEIDLRASRRQMETSYVAMIDLDGFKSVNDTYGHIKGDRLLMKVGEMLKAMSNDDWLPGRVGGDEFLIFIQRGNKDEVMDKFIDLLHTYRIYTEDFRRHKCCHEMGLSIGLVEIQHHIPLMEVLSEVDALMYDAKKDGKNGIESNWGTSYRMT